MEKIVPILICIFILTGCAAIDLDYGASGNYTSPKKIPVKNLKRKAANVEKEFYVTVAKTVPF